MLARQARYMYRTWLRPKNSGGFRTIEAPYESLKVVQRRLADLLQRIQPPPYLFAPARRRSYVDNAATHRGSHSFHLLDVADFFPNCTSRQVAWFFGKVLYCSPDIVGILVALTTRNGHLPQGSPCSPILAYLAYREMWDEIATLVEKSGCKLSLYADDITISGPLVTGDLCRQIKRVLMRHGHHHSEEKEHALISQPADITGVIVRGSQLLLPNRQHVKQKQLSRTLANATSSEERSALLKKSAGHKAQVNQLLRRNEEQLEHCLPRKNGLPKAQ